MRRLLTFLVLGLGVALQGCYQPVFAQTSNYGGVSINGTYTTNCIPVAVTAVTLQCAAITDNGTILTSTEQILLPAGTITSPSLQWAEATANAGIFRNAANTYEFSIGNSVVEMRWLSNAIPVVVRTAIGFSTDPHASAADLIIQRRGAGNLLLGAVDLNGTPVAQTISVQNAITGTDLPGKQFSLAGSLGTGAALPLPIVLQGADASVATGGTAQTEISRFVSADTKNLTSGAATTLLSIPLATLQTTGGLVFVHMEATDGTNQCTLDDLVTYSAENSAGVFVVNTSKMGTGSTACTATKSLTATYAVTSATPALLQVTPTLTGITATRFTAVYTVMHGGMTNPTL